MHHDISAYEHNVASINYETTESKYICILTVIIFWKKNKERKDGSTVNIARLVELKIITVIFIEEYFENRETNRIHLSSVWLVSESSQYHFNKY